MNHAIRLAAAGLFSAALIGSGCEQDRTPVWSADIKPRHVDHSGTVVGEGPGGIDQQETRNIAAAPGDTRAADPSVKADLKPAETPTAAASVDAQATSEGAAAKNEVAVTSEAVIAGTETGTGASAQATAEPPADAKPAEAAAPGPAAADQNPLAAEAQPVVAADKKDDAHHPAAVAHVKPAAGAPKDAQVMGTVGFAPADHGVAVVVDLKGLKPNGKHGFHIHESADLSAPDLKSAGPHFNPSGKKHGGPEGEERHGGDLGNLTADANGNVKTKIMAHGLTIGGEKDGVVGRSVIIHEKADDLKTDPAGDSGPRIAGGAIEKHDESSAAAPTPNDTDPTAARGPAAADTTDARTAAEKEAGDAADKTVNNAEKTDTPVDPAEKATEGQLNK